MSFNIEQPGNSKTDHLRLEWDSGFAARMTRVFNKKQAFVDSECIRMMGPITPRRSSDLIRAATIGTSIGSGRIVQSTPYARRQYYEHKEKSKWFEKMKNRHGKQILEGARKL